MQYGWKNIAVVAIVLVGLITLSGAAPPYIEWVRSVPMEGAGVEFRAATRLQWRLTVDSPVGAERPDLRVEITNRSNTPYLFPTIGAGWVSLERADGQALKSLVRARGLRRIEWLLVQPGESYTGLCDVEVKWLPDGKTGHLTYTRADGTMFTSEPMAPGKYKLHFRYEYPNSQTIAGHSTWSGKVETAPIEFEIAE